MPLCDPSSENRTSFFQRRLPAPDASRKKRRLLLCDLDISALNIPKPLELLRTCRECGTTLCYAACWFDVRFWTASSFSIAPATIILSDKGKKAAGIEVSDRVNRGEQVLAIDLLFASDAWKEPGPHLYAQILQGLGDRPLGPEAAQLIEIAHWIRGLAAAPKVPLESAGIRNQVVALVASALEPDLFSALVAREGMPSLGFLLEAPMTFQDTPELFCLDLYKEFDLDRLAAMAAPTKVSVDKLVEIPGKM